MPSPQKAKGSSFERVVSKFLSDLYQEAFIRVPSSGAYIGGKNQVRKEFLDEGKIRSFKGDIIPGESFVNFNCECKSYKDFPFHQIVTGSCKQLDTWLDQLMTVAEENDLNILFFKADRKGKFVAVQSKLTWVTDNFMYYTSANHGDWIILDFDMFFKHNKDLLKTYSGSTSSNNSETNSKL